MRLERFPFASTRFLVVRRALASCLVAFSAENRKSTFPENAPMLFALLALIAGSPDTAMAQSYPTHPVRIIVSSAAGGPLDVVARAVAEKLTTSLRQPVVVEARSGAGGNIAADLVSKSPPDGYTLLFVLSSTLTVNPHLYKDLSFNLKPITVVNYSTQTLFVHPSLPVNNLAEFVAWAKKEGPVTYAHGGAG